MGADESGALATPAGTVGTVLGVPAGWSEEAPTVRSTARSRCGASATSEGGRLTFAAEPSPHAHARGARSKAATIDERTARGIVARRDEPAQIAGQPRRLCG